jgi:hypothetical protein
LNIGGGERVRHDVSENKLKLLRTCHQQSQNLNVWPLPRWQ